jgi:hypothetical protein
MLIESLIENKIISYGDYKSRNGKSIHFYINEDEIVGYPFILNHFAKMINSSVNHINFDAYMAYDFNTNILATVAGTNYNKPCLYLNKQKILGSKKHKTIVLISIKDNKHLLDTQLILNKLGFKIIKTIVLFQCSNKDSHSNSQYILTYSGLNSFKNIAFFYNKVFANEISNKIANQIVSMKKNNCKYLESIEEANNYPIIYFNENNLNLLNTLDDVNTYSLKLYFKVYKSEQHDFFMEISQIYKKIDLLIIHYNYAHKLCPIIKKIKKKLGVIIYFDTENELEETNFNYLLANYNENIIGTLNIYHTYGNLINFSKHLKFIQ